jgi:hypothetical protein
MDMNEVKKKLCLRWKCVVVTLMGDFSVVWGVLYSSRRRLARLACPDS